MVWKPWSTNLCMSDRHLPLDVDTPPETQSGPSCLSFQGRSLSMPSSSISTALWCLLLRRQGTKVWNWPVTWICLNSLVLAYRAAKGSGSSYIQDLVKPDGPSTKLYDCQMACYSLTFWGAKQNLDCLLSWLHNCGTSSPLNSEQLGPYPSDQSGP